jgi:hypothetical protein
MIKDKKIAIHFSGDEDSERYTFGCITPKGEEP